VTNSTDGRNPVAIGLVSEVNDTVVIMVVAAVCVVFVGSFIATIFIPNYSGAAVFAPVFTSVGGVALGLALSRKNGTGKK
jgi:membrane associated rhomboid family serine protease